jgi:hypothetical protein
MLWSDGCAPEPDQPCPWMCMRTYIHTGALRSRCAYESVTCTSVEVSTLDYGTLLKTRACLRAASGNGLALLTPARVMRSRAFPLRPEASEEATRLCPTPRKERTSVGPDSACSISDSLHTHRHTHPLLVIVNWSGRIAIDCAAIRAVAMARRRHRRTRARGK